LWERREPTNENHKNALNSQLIDLTKPSSWNKKQKIELSSQWLENAFGSIFRYNFFFWLTINRFINRLMVSRGG
jgi:hypothetical protein